MNEGAKAVCRVEKKQSAVRNDKFKLHIKMMYDFIFDEPNQGKKARTNNQNVAKRNESIRPRNNCSTTGLLRVLEGRADATWPASALVARAVLGGSSAGPGSRERLSARRRGASAMAPRADGGRRGPTATLITRPPEDARAGHSDGSNDSTPHDAAAVWRVRLIKQSYLCPLHRPAPAAIARHRPASPLSPKWLRLIYKSRLSGPGPCPMTR